MARCRSDKGADALGLSKANIDFTNPWEGILLALPWVSKVYICPCQGTGQIDVEIHPKKRMPTAQITDFPMLFRAHCTLALERLAGCFGASSFRTYLLS